MKYKKTSELKKRKRKNGPFRTILFMLLLVIAYSFYFVIPDGDYCGRLYTNQLSEISGVQVTSSHQDVLWVHNDSGHQSDLYAISKDGKLLRTYRIEDANFVDFEDITSFEINGQDYLICGDLGANTEGGSEALARLVIVKEPNIADSQKDQVAYLPIVANLIIDYELTDIKPNVEAIAYNSASHEVYLITKEMMTENHLSNVYSVDLSSVFDFPREGMMSDNSTNIVVTSSKTLVLPNDEQESDEIIETFDTNNSIEGTVSRDETETFEVTENTQAPESIETNDSPDTLDTSETGQSSDTSGSHDMNDQEDTATYNESGRQEPLSIATDKLPPIEETLTASWITSTDFEAYQDKGQIDFRHLVLSILDFPFVVTGADFNKAGDKLIIRTYANVMAYDFDINEDIDLDTNLQDPTYAASQIHATLKTNPPSNIDVPFQPLGESISFDEMGEGFYMISEGYFQYIYHVSLGD